MAKARSSPVPVTYLDACVYLEAITMQMPKRGEIAKSLLTGVEHGDIKVVVSEIIRVEVRGKDTEANRLTTDMLKRTGYEWVPVSRPVAELARELGIQFSGLQAADAVHIATARLRGAEQVMTWDQELLKLDKRAGIQIIEPTQIGQGRLDVTT